MTNHSNQTVSFDVGAAIAAVKVGVDPGSGSDRETVSLDNAPVLKPFCDELFTAYLVDIGHGFAWMQHRYLQALNGSVELLDRIGKSNLSQLAAERMKVSRYGEHVFGVTLDGQFEASLILLDDLWDQALAKFTPNGAVVAIPARDVLAFCDSGSSEGVEELRRLVSRVMGASSDHLLSAHLFRRTNGQWSKYS